MIPLKVLGLPRFPEVGQIKIGCKGETRKTKDGTGTYNLPMKLDHFQVTKRSRDDKGVNLELDELVMEALDTYCKERPGYEAGKPRRVPVYLPYDDPNANCFSYLGLFKGPERLCWNDKPEGKATRIFKGGVVDPKAPYEVDCVCPLYEQGKCKEHYRLRVIIRLPGIPFGGFYVYRTTSKEGGRNLLGNMAGFLHESGGVLAGLPLELVCDDVTKKNPEGSMVRVTVVHLEFPGGQQDLFKAITDVRKEALARRQLIGTINKEQQKLIAQMDADAEAADADEIGPEFHPDSMEKTVADLTSTPQDPNPPAPGQARTEKIGRRRAAPQTIDTTAVSKPAPTPAAAAAPTPAPVQEPSGEARQAFPDQAAADAHVKDLLPLPGEPGGPPPAAPAEEPGDAAPDWA